MNNKEVIFIRCGKCIKVIREIPRMDFLESDENYFGICEECKNLNKQEVKKSHTKK